MHQISDDDPILQQRTPAPSALTTGNMGRALAAVYDLQAFQKRADSLLAKISELSDRIAAIEAEAPARPRIYRDSK